MTRQSRISPMLRRAQQALAAMYAEEGGGLTLSQAEVLQFLLERGPQHHRAITAGTGIDRSTLSKMLRGMAAQKLVAAVRVQEDQRAVLMSLPPAGRKALFLAARALQRAEEAFIARVPRTARAAFLKGLAMISEGA